MLNKKTLIIGASPKPHRYAYKAANQLQANGHDIVLLGNKKGHIVANVAIQKKFPEIEACIVPIHTVSLYINPNLQVQYYNNIIVLQPKRIIFNPGTENPQLMALAQRNGIEAIAACTLVMLSLGNY